MVCQKCHQRSQERYTVRQNSPNMCQMCRGKIYSVEHNKYSHGQGKKNQLKILWYEERLKTELERYTDHSPNDHSPNDQSPKDQSPNDQSPKATILRTTILRKRPFSERPISENDQSSEDWLLPSRSHNDTTNPDTTNPGHYRYCTVSKLLHILPDFLSLLHLIFHLYHRRQVLNIWIELWLNLGLAPGL
jgi:hypothetical protein